MLRNLVISRLRALSIYLVTAGLLGLCSAHAAVLFERKTCSFVQHSIEAVFHIAMEAEGKAEINVRWIAQDNQALTLRNYRILGPNGQIVKERHAHTSVTKNFPYAVDIRSNNATSRAADTEDWSTKNHSVTEDTAGVGWRFPWGAIPHPGQRGTNADAMSAVVEMIEFSVPVSDNRLKGYKLECIMDRAGQEPLVLVYPLSL